MIRNEKFQIPDVMYLTNEHRDDLESAVKQINKLQNDLKYKNDYDSKKSTQLLQLRKKFLQKKIDEYNKLNKGFEIFF